MQDSCDAGASSEVPGVLTPEEAAASELARLRALSSRDDELAQARREAEQATREAQNIQAEAERNAVAAAQARRQAELAAAELERVQRGVQEERERMEAEREELKAAAEEAKREVAQLMHTHQQACTSRDERETRAAGELAEARRLLHERESESRNEAVKFESQLALVDEELQTARDAERSASEQRERLAREEARNTVMLSLYRDQISQKDEAIEQLRTQHTEVEQERAKLADDLRTVTAEASDLRHEAEENAHKHTVEVEGLRKQVAEKEDTAEQSAAELKTVTGELEATKQNYHQFMLTGKKKEREAFETETRLKRDVTRLEGSLSDAEAHSSRVQAEAKLAAERHEQEAAVLRGDLKVAREGAAETDARLSKELSALKAEHEQLKWKHAQAEGQLKSSDRDSFDKIAALTQESDQLRTALTAAQASHQDAMELQRRQLVVVEAERDSLTKRVDELTQELEQVESKAKDASVLSWHEREQFKQLAQARLQEIEQLKALIESNQVASEAELRVVRKHAHDAKVEQRAELLSTEDRLRRAQEELRCVAVARDRAEQSGADAADSAASRERGLEEKVAELQAQCDTRGETVSKLEAQLVAQYDARALAQQNEELKVAVQTYKNKIASLNHTVSALRVEVNIVNNQVTQSLQEANTECVNRITQLEDTVEKQDRLLAELMPVAEASQSTDSQLRRRCSTWRREAKQRGKGDLLASREGDLPPPSNDAAVTRRADEQN
eukprot:Hpha_TRINITY_DN2687_c0_g1::TRINITY_DN2687_c0_g1_i1::g.145750::m.145750